MTNPFATSTAFFRRGRCDGFDGAVTRRGRFLSQRGKAAPANDMSGQTTIAASRRAGPAVGRLMRVLLGSAGLVACCLPASAQQRGGKFLDAKFCSDALNLTPGSDYDNGSCQLWKLVPDADGWSRLPLKRHGEFLGATTCT